MHVENWCDSGSSAGNLTLTLSLNVLLLSGEVWAYADQSLWRFLKWVSFIFLFSEFKDLCLFSCKGKKGLALLSNAWSHSGHLVTNLIQLFPSFHFCMARQWKENICSRFISMSIWLPWRLTGAVLWLGCCRLCLLSVQVALRQDITTWHLTKVVRVNFPGLAVKAQCFAERYYQPVYRQPSLTLPPLAATRVCTLHCSRLMGECISPGWSPLLSLAISTGIHNLEWKWCSPTFEIREEYRVLA